MKEAIGPSLHVITEAFTLPLRRFKDLGTGELGGLGGGKAGVVYYASDINGAC